MATETLDMVLTGADGAFELRYDRVPTDRDARSVYCFQLVAYDLTGTVVARSSLLRDPETTAHVDLVVDESALVFGEFEACLISVLASTSAGTLKLAAPDPPSASVSSLESWALDAGATADEVAAFAGAYGLEPEWVTCFARAARVFGLLGGDAMALPLCAVGYCLLRGGVDVSSPKMLLEMPASVWVDSFRRASQDYVCTLDRALRMVVLGFAEADGSGLVGEAVNPTTVSEVVGVGVGAITGGVLASVIMAQASPSPMGQVLAAMADEAADELGPDARQLVAGGVGLLKLHESDMLGGVAAELLAHVNLTKVLQSWLNSWDLARLTGWNKALLQHAEVDAFSLEQTRHSFAEHSTESGQRFHLAHWTSLVSGISPAGVSEAQYAMQLHATFTPPEKAAIGVVPIGIPAADEWFAEHANVSFRRGSLRERFPNLALPDEVLLAETFTRICNDRGAASELVAAGVTSATELVAERLLMPSTSLDSAVTTSQAAILSGARATSRFAQHLAMGLLQNGQRSAVRFLGRADVLGSPVPFSGGSVAMPSGLGCDCDECATIFSPGAYLIDLLAWMSGLRADGSGSMMDKLFVRRPDIGTLELTCESTNAEVLYADIAGGVLQALTPTFDSTSVRAFELPYSESGASFAAWRDTLGLRAWDLAELLGLEPHADSILGFDCVEESTDTSTAQLLWNRDTTGLEALTESLEALITATGMSVTDVEDIADAELWSTVQLSPAPGECDPTQLEWATADTHLADIARFVRVWKRCGVPVAALARSLRALGGAAVKAADRELLSKLVRLHRTTGASLDVLIPAVADLSTLPWAPSNFASATGSELRGRFGLSPDELQEITAAQLSGEGLPDAAARFFALAAATQLSVPEALSLDQLLGGPTSVSGSTPAARLSWLMERVAAAVELDQCRVLPSTLRDALDGTGAAERDLLALMDALKEAGPRDDDAEEPPRSQFDSALAEVLGSTVGELIPVCWPFTPPDWREWVLAQNHTEFDDAFGTVVGRAARYVSLLRTLDLAGTIHAHGRPASEVSTIASDADRVLELVGLTAVLSVLDESGLQARFAKWQKIARVLRPWREYDGASGGFFAVVDVLLESNTAALCGALSPYYQVPESDVGVLLSLVADPEMENGGVPSTEDAKERRIVRVHRAFRVARWLRDRRWAASDLAVAVAENPSLLAAATSQLGSSFETFEGRVNGRVTDRERSALVAWHLSSGAHASVSALYARCLIDVEMGPERTASLVQEAILATQLFVHRWMLGLESEFARPTEETRTRWLWFQQYRVWEANRKVFLWPENWVEPELRDTRTPLFRALEEQLELGELTDANVEAAYGGYLRGLLDVAKPRVLAVYDEGVRGMMLWPQNNDPTSDLFVYLQGDRRRGRVHVFARTDGDPPRFLHRVLSNGDWGPWKDIPVDSLGEPVGCVIARGRFIVCWPVSEPVDPQAPVPALDAPPSFVPPQYAVRLAWVEYWGGKWSATQTTRTAYPSSVDIGPGLEFRVTSDASQERFLPLFADRAPARRPRAMLQGVGVTHAWEWDSVLGAWSEVAGGHLVATALSEAPATILDIVSVGLQGPRIVRCTDALSLPVHAANSAGARHPFFETLSNVGSATLVPVTQDPILDCVRPLIVETPAAQYFVERVADPDETRLFPGTSIDLGALQSTGKNRVVIDSPWRLRFSLFEHPFAESFAAALSLEGLDGLFRPGGVQQLALSGPDDPFEAMSPTEVVHPDYPLHRVEFDAGGAYSEYNWELFFHIPIYLAKKLTAAGRFEQAQRWLRRVFDPTRAGDEEDAAKAVWVFEPFRGAPVASEVLDRGADSRVTAVEALLEQITASNDDPFDPHHIARLRPGAYQAATVIQYVENLIAWGDARFMAYTAESLNEATLHYMTAMDILGPRPALMKATPPEAMTVENILGADLLPTHLLEPYVPVAPGVGETTLPPLVDSDIVWLRPYFALPFNSALLSLWDTVSDRLYKIRNSLDIRGVRRSVALFAPPIDPAALVRAIGSGVSLADAVAGNTPFGVQFRYRVLLGRAREACATLRQLGGALQSALERRDGEALALLQQSHQVEATSLQRHVRDLQIQEAERQIESAAARRANAEARRDYYASRKHISGLEQLALNATAEAADFEFRAARARMIGDALAKIPDFNIGINGAFGSPVAEAMTGGSALRAVVDLRSGGQGLRAQQQRTLAASNSTMAGYERRKEDWTFQAEQAELELKQIEVDTASAQLRKEIAQTEFRNLERQISQAAEVLDFHRQKFSNKELFNWVASRVRGLYYQSFRAALDLASAAHAAAQRESDLELASPRGDAFDTRYDGLLAADWLTADLDRIDREFNAAYTRRDEITLNIPLSELDPKALVAFRLSGAAKCIVSDYWLDLYYPGQAGRRIRSVSFTVSSAVGSFGAVPIHVSVEPASGAGAPFAQGHTVLSSGQADFGVFEPSLSDERYLPFEGATLDESAWTFRALGSEFDHGLVSDIVMHVRYDATSTPASAEAANAPIPDGRYRLFTARADFTSEWDERVVGEEFEVSAPGATVEYLLVGDANSAWSTAVQVTVNTTDVLIIASFS